MRFVSQYAMTISDPRETVRSRLELAAKEARKGGRTHSVSPTERRSRPWVWPIISCRAPCAPSPAVRPSGWRSPTALATRPEILVLDEPLTAVDPTTRGQIARTLAGTIQRLGIGALIASHDVELLQRLCPQIVFLGEGRLLARGTTLPEVLARTEHEPIREFAEANPLAVQRFR